MRDCRERRRRDRAVGAMGGLHQLVLISFICPMLKLCSSALERNKKMPLCWYLPAHTFRRVKERRLLAPPRTAVSDLSLMQSWISDVSRGQDTTFPTSLWGKAPCLLPLSPSLSCVPPKVAVTVMSSTMLQLLCRTWERAYPCFTEG